jgi:hypothetical protein
MADKDKDILSARVLLIWGSLCTTALVYTLFLIPETKDLTLEQVDKMLEETTPRNPAKWKPHSTYAAEINPADGLTPQPPDENAVRNEEGHVGRPTNNPFLSLI